METAVASGGVRKGPDDGVARHGWLLLAGAIILLCYSPVLFFEYGFGEDYRLLAASVRGDGLSTLLLAEGRPVYALWAKVVFGGLDSIASLAWVRFLNIVVLAIVAAMLAVAWRRAGLSRTSAALAGAATMTLPPFQLFAGTAAMGGVPFGMALAGVAAFLAHSRIEPGTTGNAVRWLGACGLLTVGLATYQPAGLFYWVFAAILLIAARPSGDRFRRGLISFGTIAAAAMTVAFALYLIGRSAYPAELIEIGAPRGTLTFDPAGKLGWFLLLPLTRALSFWKLWPSLTLAFVLALVIAAGIPLYLRRTQHMAVRVLVAVALVPLSYLPNLLVAENHASARSMPAFAALVFTYLLITLRGQLTGRRDHLFRALVGVLAVLGATMAAYTVVTYTASPQARELEIVRETVASLPREVMTVTMSNSTYHDTLAPGVMADEFGYPSTALPWSRQVLTWLALLEARPDADPDSIRVIEAASGAGSPETLIDWGAVLRARRDR